MDSTSEHATAFTALRQFARRQPSVERCELCSAELTLQHPHLVEIERRKLLCACEPCAVLFSGQARTKYRRVPREVYFLSGFQLTDAQWDSLMIPINMAFFFKDSLSGKMLAMYPSPAGATESLLPLETWDEIVLQNPSLAHLQPDVEALLVNRIAHARDFAEPEYYRLPIDECYKLVGLIRKNWRGLSGGTEVWREIAQFFDRLKARCGVAGGQLRA